MLSGLAIDGRMGLTAIAPTVDAAVAMQDAVRGAVDAVVARDG